MESIGQIPAHKGHPCSSARKNTSANTGDAGNMGLIPGLERYLGGGHGNPPSILAWRIPWTEEPHWLQSMGLQSGTQWSNWAFTHVPYGDSTGSLLFLTTQYLTLAELPKENAFILKGLMSNVGFVDNNWVGNKIGLISHPAKQSNKNFH